MVAMHLAVELSILIWAWWLAELSVLPDVMAWPATGGNYKSTVSFGRGA